MTKTIKVCKYCSGFDVKELKDFVPEKEYKVGCIGKCGRKYPELSTKVFGLLNGNVVICDTKEDFFSEIKNML